MENKLTVELITDLQKTYGLTSMQELINSGQAWYMEGFTGRQAMQALEDGACMLPEVPRKDYWGNIVPARTSLKPGTKGTLENSQDFWQKVLDKIYLSEIEDGEIEEE